MHIDIDGTRIFFDVEGPRLAVEGGALRERPILIALHGGPGFDHGYLKPGLQALAADAQIVYVDLRGQGRSGRPPLETCTLERMADDVAILCERLGIERPIVLGHSAGGFVAMHLALRAPTLVGGLILCDSSPVLAPVPDDRPPPSLAERAGATAVEVAGRLFGGDVSPATLEAFNREVAPYYAAPSHTDVPARLLSLSTMNHEVARYFFGKLAATYDVRPRLHEICVPTLVVVGRWDWVCPPVKSRLIAEGIAGAELVEIENAGHFVFSEEPEKFVEVVRRYLRQNAWSGAQ